MRRALMLLALTLAAGPAAAQACKEIRFARGASSGEVRGAVPADGSLCYTIGTGLGQEMRIEILQGDNTVFTLPGLLDAQQMVSIVTQQSRYTILVTQLFRAPGPQKFSMLVTIR